MSLENLREFIVKGEESPAIAEVEKTLEEKVGPQKILDEAVIPALDQVGGLFEKGEYYLAEMLQSAHIVQLVINKVKPLLISGTGGEKGKVIMGTVRGDLHDIGKNIVVLFLEGAGFNVNDLGRDVAPQKFIEAVRDQKPDIVGLSALLTTTMPAMQATVKALKESGVLGGTKIIVGGSPVTAAFAEKIGADGYGKDVVEALRVVRALVAEK
jgi:5-methyltetrahydrofolate--homocysteine methyltransferase